MVFSPYGRQILVALSPQLGAFSMGGSIGLPSVLLHQFSKNESSIRPDFDTFTWIASMHGLAGMVGLLMPPLMQKIGRKRSFIVSGLLLISGWSLAFAATNVAMVLCAECLLGFGCNCIVVVNLMTVSEMLAPKYRTISMMLLGITQAAGIIFVQTVGMLLNWRILALIMCCPVIVALTMVLMWPESPLWLAYKGNYVECEKAFKWLRGTDVESMKELQELITAQKRSQLSFSKNTVLKLVFSKLKRRDFNIPVLFMLLILFNSYLSGSVCLLIYGKYIIEEATGDEKAATIGYFLLDANLFVGAFVALFLIRYFNAKTVLYIASIRVVFLLCGSLVLLLQEHQLLSKNPWIFTSCFETSMFFFCSGLNTITFALAIEFIPVKHRGVGGALYNIFTCSLHFSTNKLLPYIIMWIGVKGTFFIFGINGMICQFLIWKYVPETKNRTLQEIEDYYNNRGFSVRNMAKDNDVTVSMVEDNNSRK